jgi:hypothetical protein
MEDDYYSIDSILSENQVLILSPPNPDAPACARYIIHAENTMCLQGRYPRHGTPRWRPRARRTRSEQTFFSHPHPNACVTDQSSEQSSTATLASFHSHIFVRGDRTRSVHRIHPTSSGPLNRDYADFTIPPPFSSRVRNALNAEAKSVKLSALVGAGGLWYGFGKIIMRLSVSQSRLSNTLPRVEHPHYFHAASTMYQPTKSRNC